MKSIKFEILFLVASWVIFIATNGNLYSSVLLLCAGAYMAIQVVSRIRRREERDKDARK